jgi:hypothetical protein
MKKILVLALLAVSTLAHAEALQWTDIEVDERYILNHDIVFPEGYEFKAGTKIDVLDFIAGGIPVVYWQLHSEDCKNPDATAEMILLNPTPEDTTRDRSIAVALTEGCNLDVWVEIKDLYSNSILNEEK